jgi:hypothetical protein
MMELKAQAWGFDLMVGLMIFLFGVLFFYLYVINIPLTEEDEYDTLRDEAVVIANSLMSEGSPANWDQNNVVRIGLLSNSRVNESKWSEFDSLDYQRARGLFRVVNDFYVYFGGDYSGGVGAAIDSTNESVARVTRVVVRNNESETLNVLSWR